MEQSNRVGIVFGIIAIGLFVMPMLAAAQGGAITTFLDDSSGFKSNGFTSHEAGAFEATFFDSSGGGLEIINQWC